MPIRRAGGNQILVMPGWGKAQRPRAEAHKGFKSGSEQRAVQLKQALYTLVQQGPTWLPRSGLLFSVVLFVRRASRAVDPPRRLQWSVRLLLRGDRLGEWMSALHRSSCREWGPAQISASFGTPWVCNVAVGRWCLCAAVHSGT